MNPETGTVSGFTNETLPAFSARVLIGGHLMIADTFGIQGRFVMGWSTEGFDLAFNGNMDLGGFDAISVSGGARITSTYFAAYTAIGASAIGIPGVDIEGNFQLEVNTSSSPVTVNDRQIAGSTCQILIGATVNVLGFKMNGDLILGMSNGILGIEIKDLSLNFFNVANITVNGYVRSNGEFLFDGELKFDLGLGPFTLKGGIGVHLTNNSFGGWIYGSVNFSMDFGLFSIDFDLAGLRADFEIGTYQRLSVPGSHRCRDDRRRQYRLELEAQTVNRLHERLHTQTEYRPGWIPSRQ
ncbi:MAG UNVERIFIED_CONTAM: hypothetical protein LVR18_46810 [Planctomycetaceae bacterium]